MVSSHLHISLWVYGLVKMKQGDMVHANWYGNVDDSRWGIILEEIKEKKKTNHDVFRVIWQDGTVDSNAMSYDLTLV